VTAGFLLADIASELALFAAAGFLLFAIDDLAVDLIYFGRRLWRALTVYTRYPRAFATSISLLWRPRFIAVFIPAWDESAVIAAMLKSTLQRFEHRDYRIFVGYYRNDPATASAIASVQDERIEPVELPVDGPTTKADCLNHLYGIM
jgi:bacteriophage N4 adsorption protein B